MPIEAIRFRPNLSRSRSRGCRSKNRRIHFVEYLRLKEVEHRYEKEVAFVGASFNSWGEQMSLLRSAGVIRRQPRNASAASISLSMSRARGRRNMGTVEVQFADSDPGQWPHNLCGSLESLISSSARGLEVDCRGSSMPASRLNPKCEVSRLVSLRRCLFTARFASLSRLDLTS